VIITMLDAVAARSFDSLVVTHEPFVRAVVARRVQSPQVDDVVQEVFIAAWRKSERVTALAVDGQRGWLYHAAMFTVANTRRTDGRRARADLLASVPDRPESDDPRAAKVELALSKLRRLDRQLILAYHVDALSAAELGAAFGWSEQTARQRASRAMARLRQLLAQEAS
jgi:RNA polymerase sigma-70 factor (ECF subfamily)